MSKKVTVRWLKQVNACEDSIIWFKQQNIDDPIKLLNLLIKEENYDWCNWGISRLLNRMNKIRYALFAAKLALPIFEKKYPDDERPREAIEAVEEYLKNPSKKNKDKCKDVAWDTWTASRVNISWAAAAARSAVWSADAAYDAAWSADAAYAAAYYAYAAAYYAYAAAYDAEEKTYLKILKYGIELLENEQAKEKRNE